MFKPAPNLLVLLSCFAGVFAGLAQAADTPPNETLDSLRRLARQHQRAGELSRAAETFERVIASQERAPSVSSSDFANDLHNLAGVYHDLHDYSKAEALYLHALRLSETDPGPEDSATASTLNSLGAVYDDVDDLDQARVFYERALRIRRKTLGDDHPQTATTINNLAGVLRKSRKPKEARELYETALEILKASPDSPPTSIAAALNNLAELDLESQNFPRARQLYEASYQLLQKNGKEGTLHVPHILNGLGEVCSKTGDFQAARTYHEKALAIQERIFGNDHPNTEFTLSKLGFVLHRLQEHQVARNICERQQAAREKGIANVFEFTSEHQRMEFLRRSFRFELPVHLNDPMLIANSVLRQKCLVLDSMLQPRVDAPRGTMGSNPKVSAQVMLRAFDVTVSQVQQALPRNSALVEFIRFCRDCDTTNAAPHYGALILGSTGPPRWVPMGPAKPIESLAVSNQFMLHEGSRSAPFEANLRNLYDVVWRGVGQALPPGGTNVILSPDGWLNFLSFATLLTPSNRFLGEEYTIRYVMSGRDLLRSTETNASRTLHIVAHPEYDASLSTQQGHRETDPKTALEHQRLAGFVQRVNALPHTLTEANRLAARFREFRFEECEVQLGRQATELATKRIAGPYVLVMATHGFFCPSDTRVWQESSMRRSGLALAGFNTSVSNWLARRIPDRRDDGVLTADEVALLNLKGNFLTILSACDTGFGDVALGEGVLGLRRAFVLAGSRHLALALFPVEDTYAPTFVEKFLERAMRTGNPPIALAEVQREELVLLRREYNVFAAVRRAGPYALSSQGGQ